MALHELEKKILLALEKSPQQTSAELAKSTGLDAASVDHASAWLESKGLVKIDEKSFEKRELDEEGKKYLRDGFPERRALGLIQSPVSIGELQKKIPDASIAVTWLAKLGLATIRDGKITITPKGKEFSSKKLAHEDALEKINRKEPVEAAVLEELKKRGKILRVKPTTERTIILSQAGRSEIARGISLEKEVSQLTPDLILSEKWKSVKLREYDVSAPVQKTYGGRRHFVNQAMDYVRKVWLEMGFREMTGPLINTSFWNFDALFVPQEHSAREMQDTLFAKGRGTLPSDRRLVSAVKKAHEQGSEGSVGWKYSWSEDAAKTLVLRTHTTVLSAQTLAALRKTDLPAKFFSVGRCFRNEALDWKHLFEFNQVEGIVVDENANFRHLLGYLKEFFCKLGFPKARFKPSYFPYTEPSVEIDVFNEEKGTWLELGGAGVFRPEVTTPLLGKPVPVLAWGPGFDRLIMDYYKIADIRELYKNDVRQLRDTKQWLL